MILVEKKVLKERKNYLVMAIQRRRNLKVKLIKKYKPLLKKNHFLTLNYRLFKLKKFRLRSLLLNRYMLRLLDKNSRVSRSLERSKAWKLANAEHIRRKKAWRAKVHARRMRFKKSKRYINYKKRRIKKFWQVVKKRKNIKKRIIKIDKKSEFHKNKRKLNFLKNSVYSILLYNNYRYRFFYRKLLLPHFRYRVFRKNLFGLMRRMNLRFGIIKPIAFKKLKFLGDFYTLYDLRFYYHRLRSLNLLPWQRRFSKRKKIKQITKLYKLELVHYFINNLIKKGNKFKAFNLFFNMLLLLKYQHKLNFLKLLYYSVLNVKPLITFKVMYIGGKKYRIPILLSHNKGYRLGIKWLITSSFVSNKPGFILNLIRNLIESYHNDGDVVKKRKEYHLAGFDNKSYIRFLRFLKK